MVDDTTHDNYLLPANISAPQIATPEEVFSYVFKEGEGQELYRISELLKKFGPEPPEGDSYTLLRGVLTAFGFLCQGEAARAKADFQAACEYFRTAAERFDRIGEGRFRDLALGRSAAAGAIIEVGAKNIGLAITLFQQARVHLKAAGEFAQPFQIEIDAIEPELLFVQAISSLMALDFATAKPLIEQAAQTAEIFATTYIDPESKSYFYFVGYASWMRAIYRLYRIQRDFFQFGFDSAETERNEDAWRAKELFAMACPGSHPLWNKMRRLADGITELSELYRQLASILRKLIESTLKADVHIYEELHQKVSTAEAAFGEFGSDATPFIRWCEHLSSLINNIERVVPPKPSVVILVHGIRTFAYWEPMLQEELEKADLKVEMTNFEYFDLIRFLAPLKYFRGKMIERVHLQIRSVLALYRGAYISILAHSFGTYIIAEILKTYSDIKIDRLIFCGSIVSSDDRSFSRAVEQQVTTFVNEVGSRDIWPALAESVTAGYGRTGTYGFHEPRIKDRWHKGFRHSDFLTKVFCNQYWTPLFKEGRLEKGDFDFEKPPWWLKLVSKFKIKFVVPLLFVSTLLWWKWENIQGLLYTLMTRV